MTLRHALASLLLLGATPSLAAGRVPYGGELRVAHTGPAEPGEPALADSPLEATLLGLLSRPACRVAPDGQPVARARPRAVAPLSAGGAPHPALARAGHRAHPRLDPARQHRGPLALPRPPLPRCAARAGSSPPPAPRVELALGFPWPDLERALCHPALALPRSAARRARARSPPPAPTPWTRGSRWPRGPALPGPAAPARHRRARPGAPVVDAGGPGGARRARRMRAPPPARRCTPPTWPGLRGACPRTSGRRWRAPWTARTSPASSCAGRPCPCRTCCRPRCSRRPPGARPTPPPAPQAGRKVTLLYDASNEDQRAVAERLQVRLHDRGYTVALEPLPRAELRARWAKGDYELMLHSLLLPPVPGPALAVVLDAAGAEGFARGGAAAHRRPGGRRGAGREGTRAGPGARPVRAAAAPLRAGTGAARGARGGRPRASTPRGCRCWMAPGLPSRPAHRSVREEPADETEDAAGARLRPAGAGAAGGDGALHPDAAARHAVARAGRAHGRRHRLRAGGPRARRRQRAPGGGGAGGEPRHGGPGPRGPRVAPPAPSARTPPRR